MVSNKKNKVSKNSKVEGEELDGDKELAGKVAGIAGEDEPESDAVVGGAEKIIDPDLLVAEDDVVTGFGVEEEGASATEEEEESEDEVSEEVYDPFDDRFEK